MKKCIVFLIIGMILGGSIIGVVAYSYSAKDISFVPSNPNWKVNNMKDAIDSLKNTNDTTIANLQSSNNSKDETIANLNSQITELSKYDQCVTGSGTITSDIATSTGQVIEDVLTPTFFVIYRETTMLSIDYYNAAISNKAYYFYGNKDVHTEYNVNDYTTLANNKLILKNYSSTNIGQRYYYVACK